LWEGPNDLGKVELDKVKLGKVESKEVKLRNVENIGMSICGKIKLLLRRSNELGKVEKWP
jgi:hypothetical protein